MPKGARYGRRFFELGNIGVTVSLRGWGPATNVATKVIRRTTPEGFVRRWLPGRFGYDFAGGAPFSMSFGGTPMTFTPDPLAMSIASMTCWNFTVGSPFTKMIFSGRGS